MMTARIRTRAWNSATNLVVQTPVLMDQAGGLMMQTRSRVRVLLHAALTDRDQAGGLTMRL